MTRYATVVATFLFHWLLYGAATAWAADNELPNALDTPPRAELASSSNAAPSNAKSTGLSDPIYVDLETGYIYGAYNLQAPPRVLDANPQASWAMRADHARQQAHRFRRVGRRLGISGSALLIVGGALALTYRPHYEGNIDGSANQNRPHPLFVTGYTLTLVGLVAFALGPGFLITSGAKTKHANNLRRTGELEARRSETMGSEVRISPILFGDGAAMNLQWKF